MRYLTLLLLAGCAGQVVASGSSAVTTETCTPPAFTEPDCYSPGGGVTRCLEADGTYWDKPPSGPLAHWRWGEVGSDGLVKVVTLCEVDR